MVDKDAVRYSHLSYDEVLVKSLNVMDATSIALCRDYGMPVRVFNMNKSGSLMRIMFGGDEGTLVDKGE
jgi:uridylate kinase